MSKKDRGEIARISKKIDIRNYAVSEGSMVFFDLCEFIDIKDIHDINSNSFSCTQTQTNGILVESLHKDNNQTFSFRAPYVRDNEITTTLNFELTTRDDYDNSSSHKANVIVKRVQRAIIFQGGVALGAYEAGAYHAIVKRLIKNDEDEMGRVLANEKRPLFDIVAGTSIGAMNAAIVVSSVTRKDKSLKDPKNWEDSAERVVDFWRAQQQLPTLADFLDIVPFYNYWWDVFHDTSKVFKRSFTEFTESYSNIINPDLKKWYEDTVANWSFWEPSFLKDAIIDGWYIPAKAEATRRYYSAKQFHQSSLGPLHVASGIWPWSLGGKFSDFSELSNWMPRPDNKHYVLFSLKRTLERFAHFPINTSIDKNQPRLLLVTVDVKTGDVVTFDSYVKEAKYHNDRNTISNQYGIETEHALASGAFPDFFDYPKFKVNMNSAATGIKNEEHIFWDGGFGSNTPLRELVQAHRDYWLSLARKKHEDEKDYEYENDVPDLEVYIADLWPSELKEDPISFDRDFIADRQWDLILGDKTDYDQQVSNVVTDYIDLARRLKNLAERRGVPKEEIKYILDGFASSINTKGKTRRFRELLEGRFRLTKIVRIDRKDDGNEVHDKVFDYSYKTIEQLMNMGYQNASVQMDLQKLKDEVIEVVKRNRHHDTKKDWDNPQIQELEEGTYQIQERMKIENGYDTKLSNQIQSFINKIEGMRGVNDSNELLLREEKTLLIAAAKQLQQTINNYSTTTR